ncbi:HEPN domain-containing protein [Pedobacter lithocola]|uniref:HEPN domain-containing protein n=1 Tax=Pedobacter lithocola TaxID=1908239 RepID=A0ABV8PFD4_9SPHI
MRNMEPQIFTAVDHHARYLRTFIGLLISRFKPLQIFSFSKRFVAEEMEGDFIDNSITYKGHYCLLMVTETNTRIDHEVQDYCNGMYEDGTVTIICHGQEAISEALQKNSRFFITVYSTGELIYSYDGISLCNLTKKIDFSNASVKANQHFNHRISLAEGFLTGAKECLFSRQFNVCTFMLHQVVEQCCIGLIRVHLGYRSEVHNLNRLLRLCNSFSDVPYNMFLTGRQTDEDLFDILIKSYSQARYGKTFLVVEIDAQRLFEKISSFVELTKKMCQMKIVGLEKLSEENLDKEVSNE